MNITLRPYQERALNSLGTTGEQVLSICAGGGKTFTSLAYAERHKDKFKKVLILTHGTNVLKAQWLEELNKLNISHSTDIDSGHSLIVTIPQALKKRKIPKFDLIIVDEAHEFYYAEEMMPRILKAANPQAILLLTGTPSKFIRKGLKPVIISGVEVYQEGFLSNTYFGVVKSTYKLEDMHYSDGDVKGSVKLKDEDTNKAMDNLVKEMIDRLKSIVKNSPNARNLTILTGANKYINAFTTLGKTLIAAKDINHAKVIFNKLIDNGVEAVLSDSESDTDSEQIQRFLDKTQNIQVLVVVRRGILGFNLPELVNVVDFTMSRNIDRIYQLYARVLRKYENADKFFFRVCSALNPQVDTYYLQAAMCLNNRSFIEQYNGKNLNGLEIIVRSVSKDRKRSVNTDSKESKKATSIDEIMADQILSLGLLSEMTINSNSDYWKEFGYMKFGYVIEKLTGKEFVKRIKNITLNDLLIAKETGVLPESVYE